MAEIVILINIAGAVALLMWGTYVIRTGMMRTFGAKLRSFLGRWLTNRFSGFGAGFVLSSLLQSSTAATLLVSGLQKKGLVSTAIALAAVIGANFGSAVMVRVLSLNIDAVSPLLIAVGVYLFMKKSDTALGQFGRVLMGLGVVMLALTLIGHITTPIKDSAAMMALFHSIEGNAFFCTVLGIGLAFLCFSSLAVVIIDVGLVAAGVLAVSSGLWIVLGANLGTAFLASVTTMGSDAMTRRAPMGNTIFRVLCFVIGAAALILIPEVSRAFESMASDQVIWFHVVFNAVSGVLGLIILNPVAALVDRLLPAAPMVSTGTESLTEDSLSDPETAFHLAEGEIEKTCWFVSEFWRKAGDLITKNPAVGAVMLLRQDYPMIRQRCHAVNSYLSRIVQTSLTPSEIARWEELHAKNADLQSIGHEIDKVIAGLGEHKVKKERFFDEQGEKELLEAHARIADDLKTALDYLSADDPVKREAAHKKLLATRKTLNDNELALVQSHMDRVSRGDFKAIETSALHIALINRFRRLRTKINELAELSF